MTPGELRHLYALLGYRQHASTPQVPVAPLMRQLGRAEVRPLHWHSDARGALVELHRDSWCQGTPAVQQVAQVYASATSVGVAKGWHLHAVQTDRFTCLRGRVLLALCDLTDPEPKVQRVLMEAVRSPVQVVVPPGVAHGWVALPSGDGEAWILNTVSHEYDGTDEWRRPAHAGPTPALHYDWHATSDG